MTWRAQGDYLRGKVALRVNILGRVRSFVTTEATTLIHNSLRAILQESEAKLEMKIFDPPSIFVWRQVTLGDKQKQPFLDRQMYRCRGNRTR